jgi:predicted nuclease of restriction endonuclease-like (RecB) superfamily
MMSKKEIGRKTNAVAKNKGNITVPVAHKIGEMPADYAEFIKNLKSRIRLERTKAIMEANSALVFLYWEIGTSILTKQQESGWDAKIIDRMSHDLKEEFPDITGFSPRNLKYMRKFAEC